jgi:large subunit ribosomal protein L3
MAGHMGDKSRTHMNMKVVAIDEAHDVIFVAGSVPGSEDSWVTIRDAVKKVKKQPANIPFPAGLKQSAKAAAKAPEAEPAPADTEILAAEAAEVNEGGQS